MFSHSGPLFLVVLAVLCGATGVTPAVLLSPAPVVLPSAAAAAATGVVPGNGPNARSGPVSGTDPAAEGEAAPGDEARDLARLVPANVGPWRCSAPARAPGTSDVTYDRQSILEYQDGAGNAYLDFAFQRLLVCRYTGPAGQDITVELCDMERPGEAFGIFTCLRQGQETGIGQGSASRSGRLDFWKGSYFVTIHAKGAGEASHDGVLALGRAIAGLIPGEGALPAITGMFPTEGLRESSIRYFHKHATLNQHYFLANDNILGLNEKTEAAIARYGIDGRTPQLLLVRYPIADQAHTAYLNFFAIYAPEGEGRGVAQLADGTWTAATQLAQYFLAVFEAPSANCAADLIQAAWKRIDAAGHDR
jgi:hypothetical protein